MKRLFLLLMASALFTMPSCTDDDGTVTKPTNPDLKAATSANVQVSLTGNDAQNTYAVGDTLTFSNGYELFLSKFKFYLSNFTLVHEDGRTFEFKDVILGDFSESESLQFNDSVPLGKFTKIRFGLGLDPALNDLQPENFPREHPLSTYNQMYWTMLKYRFAIFEGKANQSGQLGTSDDALLAYHPGTDPLYQIYTAPIDFNIADDNSELDLAIFFNVYRLFEDPSGTNTIDMMNEPQSHSAANDIDIAVKFMNNWREATSVKAIVVTP